jgi:BMFP domain-containing protein YqiC
MEPIKPAPPVIRIMTAGYRSPLRLAKAISRDAKGNQVMSDRPRFFDDLAGVAGGAISALAGLRQEAEAIVRARLDETIRALDLVRRDEYDAMAEMAANARAGQEAAEARITALEERLAVIEARLAGLETAPKVSE